MDCNLEHLFLQTENDSTDEAGAALAEALMVNKTLHLSVKPEATEAVKAVASAIDSDGLQSGTPISTNGERFLG
jgi:hypothetical protein